MAVRTDPNVPLIGALLGSGATSIGLSLAGMRIYTKRGDDGTTGLLYGGRVSKADPATEAYGTVDEAVADLGLARALAAGSEIAGDLLRIQRDLFVVGADLATNPGERSKLEPEVSLVTAGMVDRLESLVAGVVGRQPLPEEFV